MASVAVETKHDLQSEGIFIDIAVNSKATTERWV